MLDDPAAAAADELDDVRDNGPDDLEPEVKTVDGGYRVTFKVAEGDVEVRLEPNDARYFAYQLNRVADEAEAKMLRGIPNEDEQR
jgi:hypothetical protein